MFDTHCHLQSEQFQEDLESVFAGANASGVSDFLIPAIDHASFARTLLLAEREHVYCGLGIHPHHAAEWNSDVAVQIEEQIVSNPKVRAVGEIGVDYYYDFAPKDLQKQVFSAQIELAQKLRKPIIVHIRESEDDVWSIIREHYAGASGDIPRGQLHCFSAGVDLMEKAVDLGFYVSFTGNITFKKSTLSEVVRQAPIDRILLETDSPYLAPVPYRGKRNSPEYLGLVAAKVAEIKGIDISDVMTKTYDNAVRLFQTAATGVGALLALAVLSLLLSSTASAQPGRTDPVGSRPPDSVMTPERRKAEELLKQQREELAREAEQHRRDSINAAVRDQQENVLRAQEQMRQDSIRAAERIAEEERARLHLLTPMPWKAIIVEGGIGIGNMEMHPTKVFPTPTSVLLTGFGIGSQISRTLDVDFNVSSMRVSDDLRRDTLFNSGNDAPTAVRFTAINRFTPGERVPTYESIDITTYSLDFRFVINPKTTFKFYAGAGYTYLTLKNHQDYWLVQDSIGTETASRSLDGYVNRGAIKLLFGFRYDVELNDQFTFTPFAQIAALAAFQGAQPNGSFVFKPDPEQLTMTQLTVGVSIAYGWWGVPRIK